MPNWTGEAYCAWSLDEGIRKESSSGGIFSTMAEFVLSRGGLVSGAGYRDDFSVEHMLIESEDDLAPLRKSKYAQSDMSGIFRHVSKAVESGKTVFFSGTPCQCAAIKAYLNKPYDTLILCDLICRGVCSYGSFHKYLNKLQEKYCSDISDVKFREKDESWLEWGIRITFKNGREYYSHHKSDPFIIDYLSGRSLRSCCYDCKFKGERRPVDVTLGDFWGIQMGDMSQLEKGVSAVILHSDKGRALFDSISNKLFFEKRSTHDIILKNPMLVRSAQKAMPRLLPEDTL